jgi:hypothetical protein
VKPKKALSSYLCFTTKNVKKVVEREGIAFKDGIKRCAELWNQMDDKAKTEYTEASQQDQIRYECEVKSMKDTGFFTNKDGVHSSSLKAKVKKPKVG